jgi:hypothetical protein
MQASHPIYLFLERPLWSAIFVVSYAAHMGHYSLCLVKLV